MISPGDLIGYAVACIAFAIAGVIVVGAAKWYRGDLDL